MLALPVTPQPLQPFPGWDPQLAKLPHPVQLVQLAPGHRPDGLLADTASRSRFGPVEYVLGPPVPKRAYHDLFYNSSRYTR